MNRAEGDLFATGRSLDVNGRRVHARVTGHGPDVILIHGASSHSGDFSRDFIGRLAKRFRVIALDRPGMGRSQSLHAKGETLAEQADHLDAAAQALGVERAVLVGHSYGGGVAMAWALEHPERLGALVTVSGVTMPWPEEMQAYRRLASREEDGAELVPVISVTSARAFTHSTLEAIFAPQPVPPGYGERLVLPVGLRRGTFRANARQVASLRAQLVGMAQRYPMLDLPVEVLHGTHDGVGSVMVHARQMARRLPRAQLTELQGIGHMPHHVACEPVVGAIVRAMARAGLI